MGRRKEEREIAWVKQKNVYRSKEGEGLRIQNIKAFNIALLKKWR